MGADEDISSRHWVRSSPLLERYQEELEESRSEMQALLGRLVRDFWGGSFSGMYHHFAGPSESHFDAIDRLTTSQDQVAFDVRPDDCWRCCAVEAENDLGTCNACRDDLRG